jgi:hypothetical protein
MMRHFRIKDGLTTTGIFPTPGDPAIAWLAELIDRRRGAPRQRRPELLVPVKN